MAGNVPQDIKSRLKSSYDAIADTYADNFTTPDDPIRLNYLEHLLSQLRSKGNHAASVLELGCGAGIPATKRLLEVEDVAVNIA